MEPRVTVVAVAVVIFLLKLVADREQDELLAGIASTIVRFACWLLSASSRADRLVEYLDHLAEHQKDHDVPGVVFSLSLLWACLKEAPLEWGETLVFRFAAALMALALIYVQIVVSQDKAGPQLTAGERPQAWQQVTFSLTDAWWLVSPKPRCDCGTPPRASSSSHP